MSEVVWVIFTKRTEDPKLAWIERQLDKKGIPHKREGETRDAPILHVPADREEEAWTVLPPHLDRMRDNLPRWTADL